MKLVFQIALLISLQILCTNALAQARLGSTEKEIRNDFSEHYIKTGYANDGSKYIYWENNEMLVAYYFNKESICESCAIFTKTQGVLNYLVEKYNKNYVIISETKWKMYSENGIMNIELFFEKDYAIIKFFN
jgi:hypothetical protein